MSSVQIVLKPLSSKSTKSTVNYRITHKQSSTTIATDFVIPINADEAHDISLSDIPKPIRIGVQADIERLNSIISNLEYRGLVYTPLDVSSEFNQYLNDYMLRNYMQKLIRHFKRRNKIRTSETYTSALNSFMLFRNGEDIHIRCLTDEIIEDYETFLTRRGLVPNTISFYMRILRAVYNRAVEDRAVEQTYPFRRVYTGIDKTVKRALPISVIRTICRLDLSRQPALRFARDMFLLSFYMRGISYIDMAYLRKTDLCNDVIYYRRHKTGQLIKVRWTDEMQNIVSRYDTRLSPFLLPILTSDSDNNRSAYRNVSYNINHSLKIIARMIGLKMPLTLYCARHSWASAAQSEGVPLSVISEGMGHRSEATTRIYLASLDTTAVDRANNAIIRLLS